MPYWKPDKVGYIVKRTLHKAYCKYCKDELCKGEKIYRQKDDGVRLLCLKCKYQKWFGNIKPIAVKDIWQGG